MPIVTQCKAPGCETWTIGSLCVEHDLPVACVFVRGRPFTPPAGRVELRVTSVGGTFAPGVRRASEPRVAAPLHR